MTKTRLQLVVLIWMAVVLLAQGCEPAPPPATPAPEPIRADDIDTPAYLRRDKLLQ